MVVSSASATSIAASIAASCSGSTVPIRPSPRSVASAARTSTSDAPVRAASRRGLEQGVASARVAGALLRDPSAHHEVGALRLGSRSGRRRMIERGLVPGRRLTRGEMREGVVARGDSPRLGRGAVSGERPVSGQRDDGLVGQLVAAASRAHERGSSVQPSSAGGAELRVQGVTRRARARTAARPVRSSVSTRSPAPTEESNAADDVSRVDVDHLDERVLVELDAQHRAGLQHLVHAVAESLHPAPHDGQQAQLGGPWC